MKELTVENRMSALKRLVLRGASLTNPLTVWQIINTVKQKLIEQGFEYVCDFDGLKLFRKRK